MGRHWRSVFQQSVQRSAQSKLSSRSCSRWFWRRHSRRSRRERRAELLQLFVAQPYLELHTGPGRGYPVTQVVGRGESVDVLFRRTDWFKVRTERGIEGWASARDLSLTLLADGSHFVVNLGDLAGFRSHRWEGGVFAGAYAGATLISAYARAVGHRQSQDRGRCFAVSRQRLQWLSGSISAWRTCSCREWRVSPFVTLGTGIQCAEPKAQAGTADRSQRSAGIRRGRTAHLSDAALLPARRIPQQRDLHQDQHQRGQQGMESSDSPSSIERPGAVGLQRLRRLARA